MPSSPALGGDRASDPGCRRSFSDLNQTRSLVGGRGVQLWGLGHPGRGRWLLAWSSVHPSEPETRPPSSRGRGALDAVHRLQTVPGSRAPCATGAPSLDTPGRQASLTASPWKLVPEPISQLIQEESEEDASMSPVKRFNSQGTWSPQHRNGLVPGSFLICILMGNYPDSIRSSALGPNRSRMAGPKGPLVRGRGWKGRGAEGV